jgi:hypothetical protein
MLLGVKIDWKSDHTKSFASAEIKSLNSPLFFGSNIIELIDFGLKDIYNMNPAITSTNDIPFQVI